MGKLSGAGAVCNQSELGRPLRSASLQNHQAVATGSDTQAGSSQFKSITKFEWMIRSLPLPVPYLSVRSGRYRSRLCKPFFSVRLTLKC
jgi:hypothetical protein